MTEKLGDALKRRGETGAAPPTPNGIDMNDPANWRDGYCPFTSTPENLYPCNPKCALYRSGKKAGFACPLTELTSMSWFMKGSPGKKK